MNLPPEKLHLTTSKEGVHLAVVEQGEGKPLVFCYGATCGRFHWKYQLQHFSRHYQTIVVDYRGHNLSSMPSDYEKLTIKGCAADVLAGLDALGIERAVFCGHSIGVNVLLTLNAMAKERVAGLILVCGSHHNPFQIMFNTELSQVGFELLKAAYIYTPGFFHKAWKRFVPAQFSHFLVSLLGYNKNLVRKSDVQMYVEGVAKHHPATMLYLLQDMSQFKGEPLFHQIDAPVLMIAGSKDLVTPVRIQRTMCEKIPHAEYFEVPLGSHVVQYDMPDVINLRIEKFLRDIAW
ncbi:MAG: alpha/beta fold hydrolase [Deltaproteobacteria bacterium]|nr:alpha/beta fold hydrolase [Deltaproteobacteria bacterium]